jgi:hypothetical protein
MGYINKIWSEITNLDMFEDVDEATLYLDEDTFRLIAEEYVTIPTDEDGNYIIDISEVDAQELTYYFGVRVKITKKDYLNNGFKISV